MPLSGAWACQRATKCDSQPEGFPQLFAAQEIGLVLAQSTAPAARLRSSSRSLRCSLAMSVLMMVRSGRFSDLNNFVKIFDSRERVGTASRAVRRGTGRARSSRHDAAQTRDQAANPSGPSPSPSRRSWPSGGETRTINSNLSMILTS